MIRVRADGISAILLGFFVRLRPLSPTNRAINTAQLPLLFARGCLHSPQAVLFLGTELGTDLGLGEGFHSSWPSSSQRVGSKPRSPASIAPTASFTCWSLKPARKNGCC